MSRILFIDIFVNLNSPFTHHSVSWQRCVAFESNISNLIFAKISHRKKGYLLLELEDLYPKSNF